MNPADPESTAPHRPAAATEQPREVFVAATGYAVTCNRTVGEVPADSPGPVQILYMCDQEGAAPLGERHWTISMLDQFHLNAKGEWVSRGRLFLDSFGTPRWPEDFTRWAREFLFTREEAIDIATAWVGEHGEPVYKHLKAGREAS